jgi:hypothetical protein
VVVQFLNSQQPQPLGWPSTLPRLDALSSTSGGAAGAGSDPGVSSSGLPSLLGSAPNSPARLSMTVPGAPFHVSTSADGAGPNSPDRYSQPVRSSLPSVLGPLRTSPLAQQAGPFSSATHSAATALTSTSADGADGNAAPLPGSGPPAGRRLGSASAHGQGELPRAAGPPGSALQISSPGTAGPHGPAFPATAPGSASMPSPPKRVLGAGTGAGAEGEAGPGPGSAADGGGGGAPGGSAAAAAQLADTAEELSRSAHGFTALRAALRGGGARRLSTSSSFSPSSSSRCSFGGAAGGGAGSALLSMSTLRTLREQAPELLDDVRTSASRALQVRGMPNTLVACQRKAPRRVPNTPRHPAMRSCVVSARLPRRVAAGGAGGAGGSGGRPAGAAPRRLRGRVRLGAGFAAGRLLGCAHGWRLCARGCPRGCGCACTAGAGAVGVGRWLCAAGEGVPRPRGGRGRWGAGPPCRALPSGKVQQP